MGRPAGPGRKSVVRSLADFPAPTPQPTECRLWQGPLSHGATGYGVRPDGKLIHRWVWEQINGALAASARVLHRCDQPLCFRYDHLFAGTQADNVADMIDKGRDRKRGQPGAANSQAKLTDDDVRAIREAMAAGVRRALVAQRFGIHPMTVSKIVHGRRWARDGK